MPDTFQWDSLDDIAVRRMAEQLLELEQGKLDRIKIRGRKAKLPFYKTLELMKWTIAQNKDRPVDFYALVGGDKLFVLDGQSPPLHQANKVEKLKITKELAAEYLRFFCFVVRGEDGPFLFFEKAPTTNSTDPKVKKIAAMAKPLTPTGEENGRFLFEVPVLYNSDLSAAKFAVSTEGSVEMLDDELLFSGVPSDLHPDMPDLYSLETFALRLESAGWLPPSGVSILRMMVESLLRKALGNQTDDGLLAHFNAKRQQLSALDQFAQFIITGSPVVAIQSGLPFIEDTVGQIVRSRLPGNHAGSWIRPKPDTADETRLRVDIPDSGPSVLLLPFHSYRGISDVDRVAHEIAARDVACLIGCERVVDLPLCLQEVIDMTVTIPRLDAELFESLFRRTFQFAPPADWRTQDTHWVTHVHYSDFQQPLSFGLNPDDCLNYIRDRARLRLRDVEPVSGLKLSELNGLGEARRFAEDLIADIREAVAGRLDWDQVDRGVLLVGAPGTGKTTLARAIAKECGIRFINASAATWQAAGHLGDHLRAMRADFSRARRWAPSILFIDEIDSIGNRDTFSGSNGQYATQVVDALLELIQGMNPEAPVIVVAATNDARKVDAALKRAGRLDREIEIPRPNVEALAKVFEFYLKKYAGANVAPGIDVKTLSQLSFGQTAADVDLYVRGAARRARKRKSPITQADLVDEVLQKPRDPDSVPRLTPADIARVAVHESGHAMASLVNGTKGSEITFVSIVPRADGRLGFVAVMPPEFALLTRREYLEQIEVMLGGRAAEEVIYGEEGITGGCQSDLEVATRAALRVATQYGLGPDKKLLHTRGEPSALQLDEANRILTEAYASILAKLKANLAALNFFSKELQDRQEISGPEARAMMNKSEPPK